MHKYAALTALNHRVQRNDAHACGSNPPRGPAHEEENESASASFPNISRRAEAYYARTDYDLVSINDHNP
jgi:hypothetical protein